MENKKKGRNGLWAVAAVILLLSCLSAVVLAGCSSASQTDTVSGEIQVSDEASLIQALKSKQDCTITVTEDILVSKELTVNGKKTLSGASIVMNMHRVGSGESVLAVSKGAELLLDGATVDGNGVVNCISVKSGGRMEVLSGNLIYGYPYGLDVSGTVDIADIHIDEALHTAINVAIFGEVNLRGGSISNNVYGIAVAEDASMEMAEGVTMTNSYASFIINYGNMKVQGGKYDGAGDNAIENWGTLSIKGTEDRPVEICNGTKSALNSKNKSTLTAEHLKIYDMGWHGMCVEKNSTANLKDVYIENAGKSTLYVSSSKANIEDTTVIGGAAYAVYGTKNAKVTLRNVTIKDTNHRGIMNEDSTLEAENLHMENTAQHGIYAKGESVTNVNHATITTPGVSAIAVAGGSAQITDTTIDSTTKEGVSVGVAGKAKLENVTITNAGNFGVASYGGSVEAVNITIQNSANAGIKTNEGAKLTVNGAVITNAGKQAICLEDNSEATVSNCTIDTTKLAAVYVDQSKLTMKASSIDNAASYGIAVKNTPKESGKKVQLDGITIRNPKQHGVGNIGSYVLVGNVTVVNPGRCGIYTEGNASVTNMNQVKVFNAGTCGFGFNGGKEITARNCTIDTPTKEGIIAKAGADVKRLDNVTILNAGSHAVYVEGARIKVTVDKTYNPDNAENNGIAIVSPKYSGIKCVEGGIVDAASVKITNSAGRGISVENGSKAVINGCVIDTTVNAAVYVNDSAFTMKNATINNAGSIGVAAENCKVAEGEELQKKILLENVTVYGAGAEGVLSTDSTMSGSDLVVEKTVKQGVLVKGGTAELTGVTVKEAGSAAIRVMNDAKVTLNGGTIYAYSYGVAADGTSDTTMTGVTVERAAKDGKYTQNALVHLTGNAKLEITDTVIDGKYEAGVHEHAGRGVELKSEAAFIMHSGIIRNNMAQNGAGVAMIEGTSTAPVFTMNGGTITGNHAATNGGGLALANGVFTLNEGAAITGNTAVKHGGGISMSGGTEAARPSFILNGGTFTGNTAPGGGDLNCTGGSAKIKLGKALTDPIHVKPNTYADTRLMAEKYGDISDSDFESSMKQILVDPQDEENWIVLETGYLGKQVKPVATIGDTAYGSLEAAITAANETNGAVIVTVLEDLTVEAQLEIMNDVTIVSNKTLTITGTASVFKIAAGKTLSVTGTEAAPITIAGSDADVIYNEGNLNLSYVNISGGKYAVNTRAGSTVTMTNVAIDATASHSINIASGATVALSDVSVTNAGGRGISCGGALTIGGNGVRIETAGDHGVYLDAAATVTGAGLQVKDTVKRGIFSNGASWSLSDVTVENATLPGIYLNGGAVTLSSFAIKNGKDAGIYLANGGQITLNGGSFTGNTGADIAYGNTAAKVLLQQALTSQVSVKPNAYTVGRVMAEKAGSLSDADFASAMKLMHVVSDDGAIWFVDTEGKLAKAAAILDGVYYTGLNDALAAAADGSTVKLCQDATIQATISVTKTLTITADKAVTLTAADSLTSQLFSVSGGTLTIAGASEEDKITLTAGTKTTALVHTNGGNADLVNVDLLGNNDSTVANNAGRGIYNEAGTVTAKSVNIHDTVKGDGIYVKAGATVSLDHVTILNAGRYGIKTYGAVNIYNTVHADRALIIQNSNDHAIDIGNAGSVNSALVDVPENTYPIQIDTTRKNTSIGILVRGGGSVDLSHFTVCNTKKQGVYFYYENSKSASGTLSDFAISEVGTNAVELKQSTAILTNGTVSNAVVKDDNSTLTENNVTVQ